MKQINHKNWEKLRRIFLEVFHRKYQRLNKTIILSKKYGNFGKKWNWLKITGISMRLREDDNPNYWGKLLKAEFRSFLKKMGKKRLSQKSKAITLDQRNVLIFIAIHIQTSLEKRLNSRRQSHSKFAKIKIILMHSHLFDIIGIYKLFDVFQKFSTYTNNRKFSTTLDFVSYLFFYI